MEINTETDHNSNTYIIKFHHPYEDSNRFLYISNVQEYNGHIIISLTFNSKWAIKLSNRSLIRKVCNRIAITYGIKEGTNFKNQKTKAIPQLIPVYE